MKRTRNSKNEQLTVIEGNSLVVQWLGLQASIVRGTGFDPSTTTPRKKKYKKQKNAAIEAVSLLT